MKHLFVIGKWFFIIWGLLSFAATALFVGFVMFKLGPGNQDTTKTASKSDVRFVLNWCNLGDNRIEEVVHSYRSSRSFTGDHLDADAIRISHVDATELTKDDFGSGWVRCDQADGVLKDAIEFVEGSLHEDSISWFPKADELNSSEMYVYSWSIYCHGTRPAAVKLIFVRPRDKMVFYFDAKT